MKVYVEHCWCGGDKFVFRAKICGGLRVVGEKWTRKIASEMLDAVCLHLPNVKRSSIRFVHR